MPHIVFEQTYPKVLFNLATLPPIQPYKHILRAILVLSTRYWGVTHESDTHVPLKGFKSQETGAK